MSAGHPREGPQDTDPPLGWQSLCQYFQTVLSESHDSHRSQQVSKNDKVGPCLTKTREIHIWQNKCLLSLNCHLGVISPG